MTSRPGQKIKLACIEDILGVPEEGTTEVDIRAIHPFENHPFKVLDDEKMNELVESIKDNGILTPVLIRPDDEGTYEMISGHRRLHAARRAGLSKVPAIIKEMNDDEATIVMVDSNLQREEMLPSEKGFAYKMKFDAISHQGKRTDLTLYLGDTKLSAGDKVGQNDGLNRMQVFRYIRITELIPELLNMVDNKKLALYVGVELSYLSHVMQEWIYEYIHVKGMIKQEQLAALREYRGKKNVKKEEIMQLLDDSIASVTRANKITLTAHKLYKYFPAYYSKAEMEKVITSLLKQWKLQHDNQLV